jgi:iron complex transport system ATP-binding protein
MIEADGIHVRAGRREILIDVSFAARAGELVVIAGPNGAGKSTLVKVVSGELPPVAGYVHLNGIAVRGASAAALARHRAVLPQATTLSFPFTVHEVVRLGLLAGVAGVDAADAKTLPQRALERVDLEGFAGRYFQQLSGGEQQRVHLARVLCQVWAPVCDGQPRFLILDEPTASLDIRHQLSILALARAYARAGGGVVAVLHDLNVAAMFADRLVVLDHGRVAAEGTPRDVLTDALLDQVFGLPVRVGAAPGEGVPFILPQSVDMDRLAG